MVGFAKKSNGEEVPCPIALSEWDPFASELGSFRLWLEATDASTLFKDTGLTQPVKAMSDPILGMKDKSGSGNHPIQATSANAATFITGGLGSLPIARFTRPNNNYYTFANQFKVSETASYYFLHKLAANAGNATIWSGDTTNSLSIYYGSSNDLIIDQTNVVNFYAGAGMNPYVPGSTWFVETIVTDGRRCRRYWDGVHIDSVNMGGLSWSTNSANIIGRHQAANNYYGGDLAGMRIYDLKAHTPRMILFTVWDMYRRAGQKFTPWAN